MGVVLCARALLGSPVCAVLMRIWLVGGVSELRRFPEVREGSGHESPEHRLPGLTHLLTLTPLHISPHEGAQTPDLRDLG